MIDKSEITIDAIDRNITVQKDLLRQLAEEQDFYFLDLTPTLLESAENGESPYFFSDTHWNQIGHDIVGETLNTFLSQITLDKNNDS